MLYFFVYVQTILSMCGDGEIRFHFHVALFFIQCMREAGSPLVPMAAPVAVKVLTQ